VTGQPPAEAGQRRSRVPQRRFTDASPADQLLELSDDPLTRRLSDARARLGSDPYRPLYHFVSPEGRMNDPNGLCHWQGRWHLFYQGYPPEDPRQHWGHAVSADLVHWVDLPYAIHPDPEQAVFSGSTLVEQDRVVAMYHGAGVGNMVAISGDPLLLNWEKLTGAPVIPLGDPADRSRPYSVFDPTIWRKDGTYYSLSAGKAGTGPGGRDVATGSLFRSADLVSWEYVHEFVEGDRFTGIDDDYACPYFLPIADRYVLLFYSHATGGQYLLGDYDEARDTFVCTHAGKFNFGASTPAGVHAPSATTFGDGSVVVVFNMNAGRPTGEWDQVMTLPRVLRLGDHHELRQEPVAQVESLRGEPARVDHLVLPANEEVVLPGVGGDALELALQIATTGAASVEVKVLRSRDSEEYTRILFLRDRGTGSGRDYGRGTPPPPGDPLRNSVITVDTSHASLDAAARSRPPETAALRLRSDEDLELRIFVDRSVVEVFANGRQALAVRVYPSRPDAVGVSLRSRGSPSELVSATVWPMKSAFDRTVSTV